MSKPTLMILGKEWRKEQRPPARKVTPTIVVGKNTVRINAALTKVMDIQAGECLLLAQDIKFPKDFYLMRHEDGFPCTLNKKTGEGVFSQSLYLPLFKAVLEQPNADQFKFKVADQPDEVHGQQCWAINTVHPLLPAADSVADQSGTAAGAQ